MNFPESSDVAVAEEEVAATEEVFVSLWVVKATNYGPNGGEWCVYLFDHGGATLVWTKRVCVIDCYRVRDLCTVAWGGCVAANGGVSRCEGVDSLE